MIIEVDENDNKIGMRDRKKFQTGDYIHRGSHIIIRNSKGQFLLQRRSKDKFWDPDKYNFAVSGTVENEPYEECIIREIEEEIGIKIPVKELFKLKLFAPHDKGFHMIFEGFTDQEEFDFEKKEIQYMKWVDEDFLRKDVVENPDKYTKLFPMAMEKY